MTQCVTCIAPVNIATIKYWGKKDEHLIIPLNDSISVTLGAMRAKTTVCASPHFKEDRMWLNKREEKISENIRLQTCLSEIRNLAKEQGDTKNDDLYNWKLHICSENDFPTAAGLASSAAGYAALVVTLAQLYGLRGDLSALARRGSGSACRSVYGGFVQWHRGSQNDGSDSIAKQIAPSSHWPELRIIILIVRKEKKLTSSTTGMKRSALTSQLLQHRVEHCVPKQVSAMIDAITTKDFAKFAEVTMKDSNQFHSVCLDTYPPAVYMTDVSHSISALVHAFNAAVGETRLAYTFDAGANACLFLLEEDLHLITNLVNHYFPGLKCKLKNSSQALPADLIEDIAFEVQPPGAITDIVVTTVGDGPKTLGDDEHLLNNDGLPFELEK